MSAPRVADPVAFIRANTSLIAPPHVPEIVLHLADEAHDLWQLTEEESRSASSSSDPASTSASPT